MPRSVLPRHYALELEPDIDSATFTGSVSITVDITEKVDEIVLNAADLDIEHASITAEAGSGQLTIALDEANERVILAGSTFEPGPAVIELVFGGVLNDKLHGFYRSTFTGDDGKSVAIATTQFQATDARRAFPCWDEPDFKATFDVELTVGEGELAVSNGPEVERTDLGDGRSRVRFGRTMKMSTYLVAFVVGPLEATDARVVDGVPLRVIHQPGHKHLTGFALDVAEHALEYFSDYYGIPYPASKLDLVAIPDFAFGAMENLGCVTFRDVYLLVDQANASRVELKNVAAVINHEIAHMWFGDLVTMGWWNGIWLNEAFATFMEARATDAFRPEWDYWTDFSFGRSAAFAVDSLESTRPVEYRVETPEDAEGMFDVLTYEKGASVVRMLEQYLGETVFRDGIRAYLARHAYGNTDTADLWDALAEVSGESVADIMRPWIFTGGYPAIWLDEPSPRRVHQRRFLANGRIDDPAQWSVPVVTRESDGTLGRLLVDPDGTDLAPGSDPYLNAGAHGFYRVRRTDSALSALIETGFASLGPAERFTVIDDAWVMCAAGQIEVAPVLELIGAFAGETDLHVWRRIATCIQSLDHLSAGAMQAQLAGWVDPLTADAWEAALDDHSGAGVERRAVLFGLRGEFGGDLDLEAQARSIMDDSLAPVAMRAAATKLSAAFGDDALLDHLIGRFRAASTPQDEQRYLHALAGFPSEDLIDRVCDFVMSDDVRTQDTPFVLRSCMQNRDHGWHVWRRVTDAWDDLIERLPSNSIARMLEGVQALSRSDWSREVHAFLEEHPVPQGEMLIAQHLELNRVYVDFRERISAELADAIG